jgi:hemerythrin superfamily protein
MDAVNLLTTDHEKMRALLKDGQSTRGNDWKARRRLFLRLRDELLIHERMEEEVLYPALKNHPKAHDIVLEGYEEHHIADLIVEELDETDYTDERWSAKWKVLKESLEHHMEEEESDMFPKAKKIFDNDDLEALGARMEQIRAESEALARR